MFSASLKVGTTSESTGASREKPTSARAETLNDPVGRATARGQDGHVFSGYSILPFGVQVSTEDRLDGKLVLVPGKIAQTGGQYRIANRVYFDGLSQLAEVTTTLYLDSHLLSSIIACSAPRPFGQLRVVVAITAVPQPPSWRQK